jgi:hypothetical protein
LCLFLYEIHIQCRKNNFNIIDVFSNFRWCKFSITNVFMVRFLAGEKSEFLWFHLHNNQEDTNNDERISAKIQRYLWNSPNYIFELNCFCHPSLDNIKKCGLWMYRSVIICWEVLNISEFQGKNFCSLTGKYCKHLMATFSISFFQSKWLNIVNRVSKPLHFGFWKRSRS